MYNITIFNNLLSHAHGSIIQKELCHIHITSQHNSLKTRIAPNLLSHSDILMCNLQTQHILMSQSYLCVARCNSTVMVIITLKKFRMKK